MAIVYQGDQGLNQGINQATSVLGQVLMQKAQERKLQNQFTQINKKIEGKQFTPTLLQEILAEPGGMQYLQQFGPIIAPVLKEQARSQGASAWLSSAFPDIFPAGGAQSGPSGQGGPGVSPMQDAAPPVSPIQEANLVQKGKDLGPGPVTAIAEARSAQSDVPDISGVPSRPPVQDSNRVGPQEQTVYQQGGQAGMGLNPPSEGGDMVRQEQGVMSAAQPNRTPANAKPQGFSNLTDDQIVKLAGSPYQEHREIAKVLQDQAKVRREADQKREERNFKINTPLYESIHSARTALPEKEIALARIDEAIQSGDINRFTDWAADRLGLDPAKTTQAQILESAVKTLFLADLQSLQGGRLNQLIEGNLLKAFQNIGKSPEANQEITETLYAIDDIVRERIKIFDDLSETYDEAGRELPRNADKRIDDILNPFVKDRLSDLTKVRKELREGKVRSNSAVQLRRAERVTKRNPPPEGTKWVLAPNGQIKAVPINQLRAAQDAKGRIIE